MTGKKVKELIKLRDDAPTRRERGLYIVEGIKMFLEADPDETVDTIATEAFLKEHEDIAGRVTEVVDEALMKRLSDTKTPQGIMCVMRQKNYRQADIIANGKLYMILEDLRDPGNLGTIVRTGEGAGVDGIILNRGCVDIYNPKTIRSTMGSIYRVPFVYTDSIADTVRSMKKEGIRIYAAHLKGKCDYDEPDYDRSAFMIGNESKGLKEETAFLADEYVLIPMSGKVESLNASIAASLLMYEHRKQQKNRAEKCKKQ